MGLSAYLYLLCTHPNEFRSLIQYKIWHESKRDITAQQEHDTSGWDRESMRRCWYFLDMTSRSFAAVIKELEGDMARMVSSGRFLSASETVFGSHSLFPGVHVLPRATCLGYD